MRLETNPSRIPHGANHPWILSFNQVVWWGIPIVSIKPLQLAWCMITLIMCSLAFRVRLPRASEQHSSSDEMIVDYCPDYLYQSLNQRHIGLVWCHLVQKWKQKTDCWEHTWHPSKKTEMEEKGGGEGLVRRIPVRSSPSLLLPNCHSARKPAMWEVCSTHH